MILKLFVATKNQSLINKDNLDITPERPYSFHPSNPRHKVFFCYDEPHYYKNITSHIRDKVVKLPDGHLFSIDDYQKVLDTRGFFEITEGHHLKQKQLDAKGKVFESSK